MNVTLYMKTTTLLSLLVLGVMALSFGHGTAFAQSTTASPKTCLSLSTNLSYGMSETRTDGAISRLQDFLATRGYFDRANMGTLRFGPLTLKAVKAFQTSQGVPSTGFVGPLTRAAISSLSCGGNPPPVSQTVSLYSIRPTAGAVGTTVSVTGFGLTNDNTVLMDGNVAARNLAITSSIAIACTTDPACHGGINQTIQFVVPSALSPYCAPGMACAQYMREVTPGTYSITVMNDNGTSNTLKFTVTD